VLLAFRDRGPRDVRGGHAYFGKRIEKGNEWNSGVGIVKGLKRGMLQLLQLNGAGSTRMPLKSGAGKNARKIVVVLGFVP